MSVVRNIWNKLAKSHQPTQMTSWYSYYYTIHKQAYRRVKIQTHRHTHTSAHARDNCNKYESEVTEKFHNNRNSIKTINIQFSKLMHFS